MFFFCGVDVIQGGCHVQLRKDITAASEGRHFAVHAIRDATSQSAGTRIWAFRFLDHEFGVGAVAFEV